MPKMTIGQQCNRLLGFLMGTRDHSIARYLAPFGFDQTVRDEGWDLLKDVAGGRLAARPLGGLNTEIIQDTDSWENLWFPIASAVLRRHHPEVHEQVFANLTQTYGAEVVVSVSTLLDRLDALAHEGAEGKAALATLAAHGLTDQVLGQARGLVERATETEEPLEVDEAELARREQEMWSYYLQWSAIARSVIKDRRMLRRLGFLKSRSSRPGDDIGDELDDGELIDDDLDLDDDLDAAPGDDDLDAAPGDDIDDGQDTEPAVPLI